MIKRPCLSRYSLLALGLTVCCIGALLAQSIRARRVQQRHSDTPEVSLSPPALSFGIQVVGTSSPQATLTLTNNGSAPLTIHRIAIAGGNSGDFSLSQNCPRTLAAGADCTLSLTFTPTEPGPRKALISISDNAGTGTQTGMLDGVGTAISLSPASLTFGDGPQTVTVTNHGSSALNLWQIGIGGENAGDFSQTTTCGSTLDAGADCTVSVTFTPTAAGTRAAWLVFSDDGGGSPRAVRLVGRGQFMALSADKTHLVNTFTNKPVFITGEAAWSLIAQPRNADVETYLADRASRGFNAVIVNLIEHIYANNCSSCPDGCPDYNGDCPFTGADFSTPNPAYFAHADYVIRRAAAYGITVFLFNSYLGYNSYNCNQNNEGWATAMESASDATMTAWGVYVGNRYKSFPNVIHVVGADADPSTCLPSLVGKLNDVATGIRSVDPVHLISADNAGDESSLDVFSGYSWLGISDMYGGNPTKWNNEYTRSDFLPPFLGEYDTENNPDGVTPPQLRTAHYQATLSGIYLGPFCQNRPIWCFNTTSGVSGQSSSQWGPGFCSTSIWGAWQDYLSSQGSTDQARLGQLFRSREHWKMVPDINHTVVTAGYGSGSKLTATSRTKDGQTIISYIPNGNAATLTVDMTKIKSAIKAAKCWWLNPRDGSTILIGRFANLGTRNFTPPDPSDWVLVIDDAGAKLPPPGRVHLWE